MEEKNAAEMLKQRGATAQTLKQKAKTKKKKEKQVLKKLINSSNLKDMK